MNRHSVSAFFAMACISLAMMALPVMGREVSRDVDAGTSASLVSIPWVAGNLSELSKALPDAKAVARFLEATFPEDFDEVPVAEYAFVDLGGDERLELLVVAGC